MKSVLFVSILVLFISYNMAANSCVAGSDNCVTCDSATQTTDVYKCSTCASGYVATTSNNNVICNACGDANCATCTIASQLGNCTACQNGYNLYSKACELPYTAESSANNVTAGALVGYIRYNFEPEEFQRQGGVERWVVSTAKAGNLSPRQVQVLEINRGSTIVVFRIFALAFSGANSLAQIQAALQAAYANGALAFYPGVTILDFSSAVRANACPAGQYPDSTGTDCIACSKDCPNCLSATECNKKKHVIGAVLGSVLGSLAVILIACILIVKRDYLKEMMSGSQSPKSTKYNLAASSPTSPTVQTEAAHA